MYSDMIYNFDVIYNDFMICEDEYSYGKVNKVNASIPFYSDFINKYNNVSDIFLYEKIDDNKTIDISINDINFENNTKSCIEAINLFNKYHTTNTFINNGNYIKVTNQDIRESIFKILNDRYQRKYLKEHLAIFSNLGTIISSSHLVCQTYEKKERTKYVIWNYYYNGLKIDNQLFGFQFDVVSRVDGQNHYRVQRLKKANVHSTLPISGEVDSGTSAFSVDNITQLNDNVKLSINKKLDTTDRKQ